MIVGIGNDIVNIERLNKTPEFLERFGKRILGNDELQELFKIKVTDIKTVAEKLAKIYAAKEAFAKALGTGFRDGIFLSDIQVLHDDVGKPFLKIGGGALIALQKLCAENNIHLSISDDYPFATAFVIIEAK